MANGAWGYSWSSSWGKSWGKTPIVDALSKSGTQRLWMYEMYAESIEEDHKKRGLIKEEPVAKPVIPVLATKKVKTKATRRAARRVEQITPYPNLPHYAPVFKLAAENAAILNEIDLILDEINSSPFNRLKPIKPKEIKIEKDEITPLIIAYETFEKARVEKVKKKRKNNEAMLLLLAA